MTTIMKIAVVAALVLAGSQAVLGCKSPKPCPELNGCDPLPGTCPLPPSASAQLDWAIDDLGDLRVFLQSEVSVAGFQFDVICKDNGTDTPLQFTSVSGGTSEDSGFTVQLGNESGRVLGFSLSIANIEPSESFELLLRLGLVGQCSDICVRDAVLANSSAAYIPLCGPCGNECKFDEFVPDCVVDPESDPVVPGVESIGTEVGVFLYASSGQSNPTGGILTAYMANSAPVSAFQFTLLCEGSSAENSNVTIQNLSLSSALEDIGFELLGNANNILVFTLAVVPISEGFSELFTITVEAACPASDICFEAAAFTDPSSAPLTSCGGCDNKCTCEVSPPSPSPIPDNVPAFIVNICTAAGLNNFVVLEDLGTTTYVGTNAAECIVGTEQADNILGEGGDDIIFGLAGNDYINGGGGADTIYGNIGADILMGHVDNDALYGGLGNDLVFGDFGNDFVSGQEGFDTLSGGPGADTLMGGPGKDKFIGCFPGEDTFKSFDETEDNVFCPTA